MTDIGPLGPNEREIKVEVKREYEDDGEPESSFYVERATCLIYEVRFFPEFALVRPAHPEFLGNLQRMDLMAFAEQFEEFYGDSQPIKDFMWGGSIDSFEISKKGS